MSKPLQVLQEPSSSADMVSPKPSSSADMGAWTLLITIISAMEFKAHDVYLAVSLSGEQKQRAPVHKKGSMGPWSGHNFLFTVDEDAVRAGCLMFKIKKTVCLAFRGAIGEVDVPVRDLLGQGGASDGKPKVMSREVRSSSGETEAVLKFSYHFSQQFPVEAPPADETITGHAAAAAPPASNSAPSYPPPAPGAGPPPSADEPVTGYPVVAAPPASNSTATYPPPAPEAAPPPASNSVASYPPPVPGAAPHTHTQYQASAVPGYDYLPPVHVHPPAGHRYPAPPPSATYPRPPPWAAQHIQPANGYGQPALAHPPAGRGYGYAAPLPLATYPQPPPWAAQHIQPAYGYGQPALAHPLAGRGYRAPSPDAGGNFGQRVMTGVAVEALSNMLGSADVSGPNDGFFSDFWS